MHLGHKVPKRSNLSGDRSRTASTTQMYRIPRHFCGSSSPPPQRVVLIGAGADFIAAVSCLSRRYFCAELRQRFGTRDSFHVLAQVPLYQYWRKTCAAWARAALYSGLP